MNTKKNLILDAAIFAAFLVVDSPALTGVSVHEWLSLAFAAAIVTHLLFHWKWLVTVTAQFFRKLVHQSRLNYVVGALFFAAMTAAMLSGLLISRSISAALGLQLNAGSSWRAVHTLSADASLAMLGIHTGLHFKWVVESLKRYVFAPVAGLFRRPAASRLAVQPVQVDE